MEVWYATLNHRPSGAGLWLRYTITAPDSGDPYCELWAFAFGANGDAPAFAGKERYTIDRLGAANGRDDGALVRIGNAWLSENHLEGEVSSNGRTMTWSLDFDPAHRCFQHIPAALRSRIGSRVSTVCSPNLDVPFSGTVKLEGDLLEIDGERGCQSHRWGRSHSQTWTWAHCSSFEEGDALFEGLAAKTRLGPVALPTSTLVFMRYDGEEIAFNELRWALRAKSTYELPTWAFKARNDRWKIAGAARVTPSKTVQVTYTDPDGSHRYCANSEIGDLAIEVYAKSGNAWRKHGSLSAMSTAHVEFGRDTPFNQVPLAF